MSKRYSQRGTQAFNDQLHTSITALGRDVAEAAGAPFVALVLGGGYGRGEGACVQKDGAEAPYNDLDLFIILQTPGPVPEAVLGVSEKYEHILGIDVDIGRPLTPGGLRSLPHELMWQDLFNGYQVVSGDQSVLTDNMPPGMMDPLPKIEALRLLLNRGSGLLQAITAQYRSMADEHFILPDGDFIRRNLQKCLLALGDSLLITHGAYPRPMAERAEVLKECISETDLPSGQLAELYGAAIEFKSNPGSLPEAPPELPLLIEAAGLFCAALLHCEQERTGRDWKDAAAYSRDRFIREELQHRGKKLVRNLVKNVKRGVLSLRYPREGLYRELASLLDSPSVEDAAWRERANRFVGLWNHYN